MFTGIKNFFILLLFVLFISQFFRPDKNKGSYDTITSFEEKTKIPNEVRDILKNNCYDCHSNTTRYPWYTEISPITHWMNYQVKEGKEHFNISEWESYTKGKQHHKLEELVEEIERKEMPLKPYTWVHGKLSAQDAEKLVNWVKTFKEQPSKIVVDSMDIKEIDSLAIDTIKTETLQ